MLDDFSRRIPPHKLEDFSRRNLRNVVSLSQTFIVRGGLPCKKHVLVYYRSRVIVTAESSFHLGLTCGWFTIRITPLDVQLIMYVLDFLVQESYVFSVREVLYVYSVIRFLVVVFYESAEHTKTLSVLLNRT